MTRDVSIHAAMRTFAAAIVMAMLTPLAARAQGVAVRTGVNVNPDQIAVGAQYEFGPFGDHFWFVPNGDLGVGNGAKLATANMDMVYRVPIAPRSAWMIFAGGGTALNYYKFPAYSVTLGGLNALGGLVHKSGLFVQATAGFLDSPQFKFGVGYRFSPSGTQRRGR